MTTLTGQDADDLLRSLEDCCSPEEARRRQQAACERLNRWRQPDGSYRLPLRKRQET